MAESGFKIADAYVEVRPEVDQGATTRAGNEIGDKVGKGASDRLRSDKGRFLPGGAAGGDSFSQGFLGSAGTAISRGWNGIIGSAVSAMGSNPYVAGGAVALGATIVTFAAPLITAGLSGAIIAGAGAGMIGLGAILLKEQPAFVAAGDRFKAALSKAFGEGALQMLTPLVDSINMISDAIDANAWVLKRAFASIGPAIKPLTEGLISLVVNALPGFLELIASAAPLLTSLGPSFASLGTSVGEVFKIFAATGPDATLALQDLIAFSGFLLVSFARIIMATASTYSAVREFITSIPGWFNAAKETVASWGAQVVSWFTSAGATISGWATGVAEWFSSAWASVTAFFTGLGQWFADLPGRVMAGLAVFGAAIVSGFQAAWTGALYWTGFAIGFLIGEIIALPGRIVGGMVAFGNMIITFFTNAWNMAKNLTTAGVAAVVSFFASLPGRVMGAISSLVGFVSSVFSSARSTATSTASSLVDSVVSFLRGLPGKAASALSGFASAVAGALRSAVGMATSIGADIISGVISGITSMIGAAVNAAKNAVGSIVQGAKDGLGISSPSKVAAKEVGRWFPPGIVEGVKGAMPAASRAIQSAIAPLSGTVAASAPAGPAAGGASINIGSITLDASKIKTIGDLIDMIEGLTTTARTMHARTATIPGV